ncbi:MAG: hypothetical protein QF718_07880 [Phycisphaerales bacterium]|jgi:hypothetical protein|nr:hypothetical protein [Phycisphaerales bacterium]
MQIRRFQLGLNKAVSTPVRISLFVFGAIVILPIFALFILAGTIASVVFGVLLLIGVVNKKLQSVFNKRHDGRKNVRIRRE